MRRLTIAIDPELKATFGPEISWTWRQLLSGIGFAWDEVPFDEPKCDIIYSTDQNAAERCCLFVPANPQHWRARKSRRLDQIGNDEQFSFPIFTGENLEKSLADWRNGRVVCHRDLIFDTFWLATGQEEQHWDKNRHGHLSLTGAVSTWQTAFRKSLASDIGAWLEKTLYKLGFDDPMPRWPNGKRAAVCVGHDVDYPEVVRWLEPFRILARRGLNGIRAAANVVNGRSTHWHFASWVELEKRFNTRSAFYFVPRCGSIVEHATSIPDSFYDIKSDRFSDLFKYLRDEGWEIGLHASYRAYENRDVFAKEKETLELASEGEVVGNRHHYWHMHPDSPESTLRMHEEIGLTYDTSLTHDKYVGWRRCLSWPFFPFDQNERREIQTLQIGTSWMDDQLFGHKENNPGVREDILTELADTAEKQGGCLNIDIHDYVFDDILFPAWAETFRSLMSDLSERTSFWMDTPEQIAHHWIQRSRKIAAESVGLSERSPEEVVTIPQ